MNTKEMEVQDSPGVQLAKKMLERQKETINNLITAYNNPDSEIRKQVEKLKKENELRGTPVVS